MNAYSFDVFDTCLARRYLRPLDVFFVLAEQMLTVRRGHGGFGPEEVWELAADRRRAEEEARRRHSDEDVVIEDIYRALDCADRWGIEPDDMRRTEIELEVASVRPIRRTAQVIQRLRMAGERVIFVSDMYLPSSVVRRMLVEQDVAIGDEAVYVSGELGVTKRSGRLFDHVLACEGLRPDELVHVGDSVLGDLLPAKRRGLHASIWTEALPNRFEEVASGGSSGPGSVAGRIAGLCRATRLAAEPDPRLPPAVSDLAADVVAPLLTGFTLATVEDARRRGIKRLYFMARDGQVIHRVAHTLFDGADVPEFRYLYGSRQAWLFPAVFDATRDELGFALLAGQSSAPRHRLARLCIEPEAIASVLLRHGLPPTSWDCQLPAEETEQLWRVLEEPAVSDMILRRAERSRAMALTYFRQEGLFDDDAWALVDVGWTLRAQAALKKLLDSGGQPHLHAYYLGLAKARLSSRDYGAATGWLIEDAESANGGASPLFENKGLIDQIFTMADHGSTREYRRTGHVVVPDLAPLPANPLREAFVTTLQGTAIAFAREVAQDEQLAGAAEEFREVARRVVSTYLSRPRRRDADAIAWARISDDPNELRCAPLARPLTPLDVVRVLTTVASRLRTADRGRDRTVPAVLRKDLDWGFSWIEGSLALTRGWGRPALWGLHRARRVSRRRRVLVAQGVDRAQRVARAIRPPKWDLPTEHRTVAPVGAAERLRMPAHQG